MNPLLQALLGQKQGVGTPPFNPSAPTQAPALGGTQFLLNALSQSGRSLTPGKSPIGVAATAGLMTQQQNQQQQMSELQRRILENRLKLDKRRVDLQEEKLSQPDPQNTNVQSTFQGKNGNMWIVTRDGSVKDTGVKFSTSTRLVTQSDGSVVAVVTKDPANTTEVLSPNEAADSTRRKAVNQSAADATVKVPGEAIKLDEQLNLIESIRKHPGLSSYVGVKGGSSLFGLKDEPFAGTDAAGFKAYLDQLAGGAFMQAYQSLKGGGQITEIEAEKAEKALNRLSNTDQKESEWLDALKDYEDAIREGFRKLEREAAGDFSAGGDGFEGFEIVR